MKDTIENLNIPPHGLCNRVSNNLINHQERYNKINDSLKKFFEELKEQAETHATRVIRKAAGVTLRDNKIDTIELTTSMTNRQLHR